LSRLPQFVYITCIVFSEYVTLAHCFLVIIATCIRYKLVVLDYARQIVTTKVANLLRTLLGRVGGYRSVWHTLRMKYNLITTRETVRLMLRQIDPIGVQSRQRHRL